MSEELAAELATRLREAHRRVAGMHASDEEKASATRRLLAISDAAKLDLARAAARLDSFEADLDHRRPAAGGTV